VPLIGFLVRAAAADTEQCNVSDISSRNSETNNFQNRKAEFETKINLIKKECIAAMPPHM
jgi:hypothetical protein